MTGSRVKAFCFSVLVGLFVVTAVGAEDGPASGAPRGLTSSTPPVAEPEAKPGESEFTPPPATEHVLPDQVGKPHGAKVTVSGLEAIDPSGSGLIDSSSGGFAANFYEGSPRSAVMLRVSQLPASPNSPAMQNLLRRVLLSRTKPPAGQQVADEPGLLAHRLNKLVASGRVSEAASLGTQSSRDDRFARQAWSEALLLSGRDQEACGDGTAIRQSSGEEYWLKLRAYCYIVENDLAAATLTLDVMKERAVNDDAFFALAGHAVDGAKLKLDSIAAPSGIHLALIRRTGAALPANLAGWLPGNVALRDSQDALSKIVALERAAVAGLVEPDDLAEAYNLESFTPDQIDDPEEWAAKLPVARANALYFQAISKRTRPAAKAAAFAAALDRAEGQNRFALFAQVSRRLAMQMPAVAETAWLAPNIIRVLLYNGDAKQALAWSGLLSSPTDLPAANAYKIQAALAYPSVENLAHLQASLVWLGQNALKPSGSKEWLMARALREVPLFDALGYTIPPEAQWALSVNNSGAALQDVSAEAMQALPRSVLNQRKGETVLNALVALGNAGPVRAPVSVVARVVDALATIGMRDEARAIANEAVLGTPVRQGK